MKKTVWLVRHGATDWNAQLRWQGHIDIPLNPEGLAQAALVAETLRSRPLAGILSSDLRRAHQTALAIAAPHDLDVLTTDKLREVHVGDLEGLTTPEVIERFEPDDVSRWRDERNLDWPFPNGESKREALHRGLTAIDGFVRWTNGSEVAVVFHSLILRLVVHSLFPAIEGRVHVPNCKHFEVELDEESHRWTARGELADYLPEDREATA